MPVGDPVTDYDGLRQHDIALKTWIDDNLVHKSGTEAETIGGIKTYSSSPLVPTPSEDDDSTKAANTSWIKDQFESMHLPIFIDGTKVSAEFYVDGTSGSDTTGDGSQPKPWKTIAHAAETIANNYNINTQKVHINVAGGTYAEAIELPQQTRTVGSVTIRPADASDPVTIDCTFAGSNISSLRHVGGVWEILGITINLSVGEQPADDTTHYYRAICSFDSSGSLTITKCPVSFTDGSLPAESGVRRRSIISMFYVDGGNIFVGNTAGIPSVDWSGTSVNASATWIQIASGMFRTRHENQYTFNVSGSFSTFLNMSGGTYRPTGTGNIAIWGQSSSPTGVRYRLSNGAQCTTLLSNVADVATYFPGDTGGIITAGTGCILTPAPTGDFSSTPIYNVELAEDLTVTSPDYYTIDVSAARARNLIVLIYGPQQSADATWVCSAVAADDSGSASGTAQIYRGSANTRTRYNIINNHGFLDVTRTLGTTMNTVNTLTALNGPNFVDVTSTYIGTLRLYPGTGVTPTLYAGTKITVYAVKEG